MDGSGRFPTAAPQTTWGIDQRVVWATPLPAWSNCSPLLAGDRLFVTAEPATLVCLDRAGMILWQHTNTYEDVMPAEDKVKLTEQMAGYREQSPKVDAARQAVQAKRRELRTAEDAAKAAPNDAALQDKVTALKTELQTLTDAQAAEQKKLDAFPLAIQWRLPQTHASNGYASNTPTSDGKNVYVAFGSGVVASYTLDGTLRWQRFIEKPFSRSGWGHSCTPVLLGDALYIQLTDFFALDAATGETRWQVKHNHIWGTVATVHVGDRDVFYTDCGEVVDPATGKTLAATDMVLDFGSPFAQGDTVYCASGPIARAFRLAPGENGAVTVTKLWETAVKNERYYAAPLLHEGLLYVINQQSVLSVLDAATGEKVYEQNVRLGGVAYTSPTLAGNVIIVSSDSGRFVVFAPGREYKELGRPSLEPSRATPICDGARMYLHTGVENRPGKLYCIGE